MWEKTDIYPYHRKGLITERGHDKKGLGSLFEPGQYLEKIVNLASRNKGLLVLGMGLLLARAQILGELMPFGIAFLGAVAMVRGNILPVLLAVALGTTTVVTGAPLYLTLAALVILAVGLQLNDAAVKGHWLVLPAAVFVVNFVVKAGGYLILDPGVYYWVVALVESLLAAGITVLLVYTFTNMANKGFTWDKLAPEEMACLLVICLGLVIGLGDLTLWELSLRAIVSKLAILAGALIYGPGAGAIIGSMVGVIPGGGSVMTPAFAGILAFSGVLAGVFRQFHKPGVLVGFLLGNLIFTVYLADQLTVVHYLGETVLAGLVLLLLPIGVVQELPGKMAVELRPVVNGQRDEKKETGGAVSQKVKELSQIFKEIARTFEETMQEGRENAGTDLVVENVKNKLCRECSGYKKCWTIEGRETVGVIMAMVEHLKKELPLTVHHLPSNFHSRCSQNKEFVMALCCSYDTWQVNNYWQQKIWDNSKLVPLQLKGLSEIMENLVEKVEQDHREPNWWEDKFLYNVRGKGIPVKEIKVGSMGDEGMEVRVTQTNCNGRFDCTEIVAITGVELFGKHMKVQKLQCDYQSGKGNCKYKLKPALQYKVAVGKAYTTKTGSPVSGDSFSLLPLSEGKFGVILSDGMGTGQKAKLESNTTIALLEHLLESGFDRETAVKTINSILILRSQEESFATLDMAIIDLYSGILEHTKIGAVPSFLKRGSKVGVIQASSLPIGILNKVESVTITEQLQVGDIIVIVSDGVLEAEPKLLNKEKWVQDLLVKLSTDDPQEIADQILFQARILAADNKRDDMTVLVGRIDSRLH
jgi:stage II sporulation protein E